MLLVSLCDVSPQTLNDAMRLRQMVESACGGAVTWQVTPVSPDGQRLDRCTRTRDVLTACAGLGDEIALYGATEPEPLDNLFDENARWLADLDWRALDAEHHLRDSRHIVEDALSVPIEGFAGPAFQGCSWIPSVLRDCGFSWYAESRWIDELPSQRRLCTALRPTSRPLAAELTRASRSQVIRITLSPADLGVPTLRRHLEQLGCAYGPSRSTTHMLQSERRGVSMPPEPVCLAIA